MHRFGKIPNKNYKLYYGMFLKTVPCFESLLKILSGNKIHQNKSKFFLIFDSHLCLGIEFSI